MNVNPNEFGSYLKQRCGVFTPAVVVCNMHRDILQRLLESGDLPEPGGRHLLEAHFAVLQVVMQTIGKSGHDVPEVLKLATETAETLRKLDALATLKKDTLPEVDPTQIMAGPGPLEK